MSSTASPTEFTLEVALTVNGTAVRRPVAPRQTLVDFLREALDLTGSHVGCEHGVCGACTVRVDGAIVRGCLMLAVQADGSQVETIEGAAARGEIAALQRAFREENALQCGFCTPGMLLTAQDLLQRVPRPDDATIREALAANYCRCTGYHAIVRAVRRAAEEPLNAVAPALPPEDGGYIGRSVIRPQTARLVAGRGTYTDDLRLSRMAHAAFVADDCGRIINPMLVDEQVRGGVAHGLGDALWEHCVYDEAGQLLTTTMMDYLVPMAAEVPDIWIAHTETPTAYSEGGFKGAGEAGVAGAPGAVLNAVNDALFPLGARVTQIPITPEVVRRALGRR